jgi:hypothetical protein
MRIRAPSAGVFPVYVAVTIGLPPGGKVKNLAMKLCGDGVVGDRPAA